MSDIRNLAPYNTRAWKESQLENWIRDKVKHLGGIAYKFTSPARASVPDRLIILPRQPPFFIEVKRWGAGPTEGQVREIQRLLELGQYVYVIDNVTEAEMVIHRWNESIRLDCEKFSCPKARDIFR